MPITYSYNLELVRLPRRRRIHFVAAISGTSMPPPQDFYAAPDRLSETIDQTEFMAEMADPDRWLAWRATETVCGTGGPWTRDVSGLVQYCGACFRGNEHAYDAAPADAKAKVATPDAEES